MVSMIQFLVIGVQELVIPSISRTVREIVENDLSLQDALQRRYGNTSAIARLIRPSLEGRIGRRVKVESIVTALRRARINYARPSPQIKRVLANSVLNVRTDVAKLSLEMSRRALEATRRMLATYHDQFLQVSESLTAITLVVDRTLFDKVRKSFDDSEVLEEESDLAAIIVHSPEEIIKTPGCAISFLNRLSRSHINIEDIVSCFTDTIIVVNMREVGKAFAALTELISEARGG